jgi:hypothetical protein
MQQYSKIGQKLGGVTILCVAVSVLIRQLEVIYLDRLQLVGLTMPLASHLAFGGLHRLWLVAVAYGGVLGLRAGRWLPQRTTASLLRCLDWAIIGSLGLGLGIIALQMGVLAQRLGRVVHYG